MDHDFAPLGALHIAYRCLQGAAAELTIAGALATAPSSLQLDCRLLAQALERELDALHVVLERNGSLPLE
jgi:hypothetical protein